MSEQKDWGVKQVNRDWARDLLDDGDVESVADKLAFLEAQARTSGKKDLVLLVRLRESPAFEAVCTAIAGAAGFYPSINDPAAAAYLQLLQLLRGGDR
jgi:hypothetical protein